MSQVSITKSEPLAQLKALPESATTSGMVTRSQARHTQSERKFKIFPLQKEKVSAGNTDGNHVVEDEIQPHDSISNVTDRESRVSRCSRTTKGSSKISRNSRMQAAARKAALQVQAEFIKQRQELEQQKQKLEDASKLRMLNDKLQWLGIQKEIAQLEAEEAHYSIVGLTSKFKPLTGIAPEADPTPKPDPAPANPEPNSVQIPKLNPNTPNPGPILPPHNSQNISQANNCNSASVTDIQIQIMQELLASMQLPKVELPVFDGNPLDFCAFIQAFNLLIVEKPIGVSKKLYYLYHYTEDEAKDIVKSWMHLPAQEAYDQALTQLNEKYGHPLELAIAHTDEITQGPPIKNNDAKALEAFATKVVTCRNTLKSIGYLYKMDSPDILNKVIGRLPYPLRRAWLTCADDIMYEQKQDVTIDHIAKFIKRKAREINNPVFAKTVLETKPNSNQNHKKSSKNHDKRASTFAINTQNATKQRGSVEPNKVVKRKVQNPPNKPKESGASPSALVKSACALCDSTSYFLNQCNQFRAMELDDRIKYVQNENLCFACLHPGHFAADCTRKKPYCIHEGCQGLHTTLLHHTKKQSDEDGATPSVVVSAGVQTVGPQAKTYLPVLPVRLRAKNGSKTANTYAFLDRGSTASFLSQDMMKQLNLNGQKCKVQKTTINKQAAEITDLIHDLEISDIYGNVTYPLHQLYSTKVIPVTENDIIQQNEVDKIKGFEEVSTPKLAKGTKVDILIGCNFSNLLAPQECKLSHDSMLYASKTALGWVVSGPSHDVHGEIQIKSNFVSTQAKQMCELCFDNIESIRNDKTEFSVSDKKFIEKLNSTIKQKSDGHYEIPLPVKNKDVKLPNNFSQAKQRLLQLKSKFLKNPKFFEDYKVFLKNMIIQGYAVKADKNTDKNKSFFIPHHGVYHQRKPEKIRVVFDCAAKYNGISMNDYLMKGPNLMNTLNEVLTRFRLSPVAVMGDINSMFHQVKIPPEDQPLFSFLWWKNDDPNCEVEVYQMTVYIFGTNCSPACARFNKQLLIKQTNILQVL